MIEDARNTTESAKRQRRALVGSRNWLLRWRPDEDFDVLAGRDQPVLDLLAPKPTPPGAFETVAVRCLSEAAFHEMLSSATILFGGVAQPLGLCALNELMLQMTMQRSAIGSSRALAA